MTGQMSMAFVGDTMPLFDVMQCPDPRFAELLEVFGSADVRFANLEGCIQQGEDWHAYIAGGGRATTYLRGSARSVEWVKAMGVNIVSTANNHAADFCEGGVLTTLRYLDRAGLAHTGTGATLREATAPTYVDTPNGRVAFVNASDWGPRGAADLPYPMPMGVMAADQGPYSKGRPGLNLIRYGTVVEVDSQTFDELRRASTALGWEEAKATRGVGGGRADPLVFPKILGMEEDTDDVFHFMGARFLRRDAFSYGTWAFEEDLERNYYWIEEARRLADYVVAGIHQQGASRPNTIADHVRTFAQGAIDAGADLFIAHGRGRNGGIELRGRGAIIYGAPTIILPFNELTWAPEEMMARWEIPITSRPMDLITRRMQAESIRGITISSDVEPMGASMLPMATFNGPGELAEIKVVPLAVLGDEVPRAFRGLAVLGDPSSDSAKLGLEVTARRSKAMGTTMEIVDGVGVVRPGKQDR